MIGRLLGFVLCLVASGSVAQVHQIPNWPPATNVSASYVGPGDVQAANVYYALRAYTAATRGNNLVNVCTTIATVDTCADMVSDAITGALVITVIGGAACNTGSQPYNIKIWYDLTGGGADQVTTSVSTRATLSTCTGSTAGATFNGTVNQYQSTINVTPVSQPFELVWATSRTGNFTTQGNVFEAASLQDGYWTSTNTVYGYTGTVQTATASDSACHVVQIKHNGASGSIQVDNTLNSSLDMSGGTIGTEKLYMSGFSTGRVITGTFYEGGLVASGFADLYPNIHGYGNC